MTSLVTSSFASPNEPLLCRLPKEIQEEIISDIDLHRDLISLALSCHALHNLVVPRHSEYRILRVRHGVPSVWAHLARRRDLAKNIRFVSICKRSDYSSPDHWPSKLVGLEDQGPDVFTEEVRVKNLCQALSNMSNLSHFAWSGDLPVKPTHEEAILEILTKKVHLRHLFLGGEWGRFARGIHADPNSDVYPLWRIRNLKTLMLRGSTWIKPANAPHVLKLFSRNPKLEKVQIPMEFTKFPECHFTHLKSLNIPLLSGARPNIDAIRAAFIQRHTTLEELFWVPLSGETQLPSGCLPNLKVIRTHDWILERLANTSEEPLALETVQFKFLDNQGMAWLQQLNKDAVRRLSFENYDGISYITQVAQIFPNVTHLRVGQCHRSSPAPLATWVKILSSFPNLEVFRGEVLWECVNGDKDKMHSVVLQLIQKCPKLKSLDHCNRHARRNHDVQRIAILREGPKRLDIRYIIEKPPPRSPFDNICVVFD